MKLFRRTHFCSPHARGFTLVEILVSVIILSIGILAVSQMTVMGMKVNTKVNKKMHARAVLAQVFEDLNNLPPNAPELHDPDGNADLDDTLADHYSCGYLLQGGRRRDKGKLTSSFVVLKNAITSEG